MANHFIISCFVCNKVISQCRCPATDKIHKYDICEDCEIAQKTSQEYKLCPECDTLIKKEDTLCPKCGSTNIE